MALELRSHADRRECQSTHRSREARKQGLPYNPAIAFPNKYNDRTTGLPQRIDKISFGELPELSLNHVPNGLIVRGLFEPATKQRDIHRLACKTINSALA